MTLERVIGTEAEAVEGVGADVGDEHVGLVQEPLSELDAALGREVEGDAALAPVVELEHGVDVQVAAEHPLEPTGRVATGRLDLHDVGAPVRQDPRGAGTGHPDPELDDPYALEGAGHDVAAVGVNRTGIDSRPLTKLDARYGRAASVGQLRGPGAGSAAPGT